MKTLSLICISLCLFVSCKNTSEKQTDETNLKSITMKTENAQQDWEILFDGTSFNGWHEYLSDSISDAWKIEDKAMVFTPPAERKGRALNIVTDQSFTNFVLSLEWKISEGGNSGLFWGVQESTDYPQPYETGAEIQILDDDRHPDAKNGTTHKAGSLYDMIAAPSGLVKPAGEWNHYELEVNHSTNLAKLSINGQHALSFPLHGEAWDQMVANSKFATWPAFAKAATGKIGLQDHGDKVWFRNIKIKRLL